jgi:hypothetical protein
LMIIGFLVTYQDMATFQIKTVIEICVALTIVLFLVSRLLKSAIHEFSINWPDKKMQFYFYKTKTPLTVQFEDIQGIKVNGPIFFKINGKSKLFSTNKYKTVLTELRKIREIEWGKYCDVLGPDKNTRSEIDSIATGI